MFRLETADESLLATARHQLDVSHDYAAAPELVHRSFLAFVGDPPWSPGFLGVDWWTEAERLDNAVMDELYAFMRMRVHVIEHVLGQRSVAYVSRWSLPLAVRMVQVIELTRPSPGISRLRYRVAYDAPRLFERMVPPVEWAFRTWFEASLCGLDRHLRAHPESSFALGVEGSS
ncbi:MAG: hypothetical protein RL701_2772 [Pseudomonadota bacterium]